MTDFYFFFNTKSWFLLLIKFRMWHCRHRLWRALLRQHFQILSLTYHKCMSLTIKCSPGKSFFHAFYKHSPLYNFSSIKLIALKYYLILILRFMLCYWVALSQWCWCKLGASFPGSTSAYPEPQLDPLPGRSFPFSDHWLKCKYFIQSTEVNISQGHFCNMQIWQWEDWKSVHKTTQN